MTKNEQDALRYYKLRRYMGSNVEDGWKIVEQLGGVCAWLGFDNMDEYLDSLPECSVGMCEGINND